MSEEFGDKSRVMVFLLWRLLWISSRESGIECNSSAFSWIFSHFLGTIGKKKSGFYTPLPFRGKHNHKFNEGTEGNHPLNVSAGGRLSFGFYCLLFHYFCIYTFIVAIFVFPFTSVRLFH